MLGVPAILGVMLAYRCRDEASDWMRSHYVFQIRTFWIGLIAAVLATVAAMAGLGILGVFAVVALVVWVTLRCFVGMVRLHRGEPIYNPRTWIA